MRIAMALVIALACFTAASVSAHKGASGVVKQRMDVMRDFADAAKAIKAQLYSKDAATGADLAAVRAAAAKVAAGASHTFAHMYPKGSNTPPSEARDEIWKAPEAFGQSASDLEDKANVLAKAESLEEARTAFTQLAAACATCHRRFRASK